MLNRFEYYALVAIKKKSNSNNTTTRRKESPKMEFGQGHPLKDTHHQTLKSKQPVVVTFGDIPQAPTLNNEYIQKNKRRWENQANTYAKHILIIFRPETELFETGQQNKLE